MEPVTSDTETIWKQFEIQFQHHRTFLLLFSVFTLGVVIGHLFFPVEPFHPIVSQKLFVGPRDRSFIQHEMFKIIREYSPKEYSVQKFDRLDGKQFQKPVVIARDMHGWNALNWNDEYLKLKTGSIQVNVETSKQNKFDGENIILTNMHDFLEKYNNPARKTNYFLSNGQLKTFSGLERDLPKNLKFVPGNWKASGKVLMIGSGGQSTSLRSDFNEQIICQLKGTRTVLLYDPFQTDLLHLDTENNPYVSRVDPINPDFEKYPRFVGAQPLKVTLKEGEMLYVPFGWYHMVSSREKSYSVEYQYTPDSELDSLFLTSLISPFWKDPYDEKAKKVMNRKTKWKPKRKTPLIE